LSNESHRSQEPEDGKLPKPDQDRSLEAVIHDLRRVLSANGELDGDEVDSDSIERGGFTKLRHNHGIGYEDSYAFVRDDSVVFDMRPANVFVPEAGIIIPVDCIPVRMPPGKRSFFDKSRGPRPTGG
jgi:hypothetical protein